ncbi:Cro/C1-type HTH DNA-binding domain-containing protein [Novosphingobium mathurense]|uniref:Cro/C1-type HTH DNA-binding domain-containing protein n=2 Tax=Sphingomonadaceae TaxID=41297 RepID=A0A1U6HY07_9SPHN|nr:conserved hypothetical protein [Novosphingobium sp. KN65.2]SLK00604.1 Cro/C1-type HTH DNA-binding domain-containing protein [Novosphingobium mathurense]
MLGVLRRHLRHDGWTAPRLAEALGIGEATAKRWLVGKGLTLKRLETLAELCGMSISELAREAEQARSGMKRELTLAQERALSADVFLSFLFMTILAGASPQELAEDFELSPSLLDPALAKLERLALIDRLRGNRVRPLVDRNLIFRKLPMRELFEKYLKVQFMTMDFGAPDSTYTSELLKLSDAGAGQLAEMFERLRREAQALGDRDRENSLRPRRWFTMMCAMRPFDTSGVIDSATEFAEG